MKDFIYDGGVRIGYGRTSLALSLLRQIVCLLPLFWLLAKLGLGYTWLAFPLSELISGGVGFALYLRTVKQWQTSAVTWPALRITGTYYEIY